MAGRRLNTVWDLSSLRLHPDGSRVEQSSRNSRPRTSRTSVQDSRGNWFARDAGGLGVIRRYRKARQELEDGECINLDDGGSEPSGSKGKAKRKRDGRAEKRRKFVHDFSFLANPSPGKQPLPSSDLLKCIHYFACQYYYERGQLFNASRLFRQERKQRRLEGEKRAVASSPAISVDAADTSTKKSRRGGRRKGGKVIYKKDMYRVMDGSALIVIAMLLQEHIDRLMEIRIPDGWEEDIRNAETDQDSLDDRDDDDMIQDNCGGSDLETGREIGGDDEGKDDSGEIETDDNSIEDYGGLSEDSGRSKDTDSD